MVIHPESLIIIIYNTHKALHSQINVLQSAVQRKKHNDTQNTMGRVSFYHAHFYHFQSQLDFYHWNTRCPLVYRSYYIP